MDEQHADNERSAHARGVALLAPYAEPEAVSASRYGRGKRDDFARLLADLEAGRFGADELILWESSRGSRKVSEWARLVEACEAAGVDIAVTSHGRVYQPGNHRDRRSLIDDANDSEYESGKLSSRVTRAMAANAADGKPHGPTPYGYRRRYDQTTRKLIAQEPDPATAPVIAELFERLEAGHSFRSIGRDFEARGIRNGRGKPFTHSHLRSTALKPVYAGQRVHDPRPRGSSPTPNAVLTEGTWDAIVPRARWLAVQRILSDPKRKTSRPGRAKHLLSMIARCGECGGKMAATFRREPPEYVCQSGCVRVRKVDLDDLGTAVLLAYLDQPEVHDRLAAAGGHDVELQAVRDDLAGHRARLVELGDAVASGALSVTTATRAEPQILAAISAAERREADLITPSALTGLIGTGDLHARWDAAPVSARRDIARLLMRPDVLGELRVLRRPQGRRNQYVPIDERVVWWRG